nr:hypothetical protein [uncultured Blautia sp.]
MNTLFHGVLMLATCAGCYLLWWGVAFYPERHAPLWLSGILLVATAVCGIMAVNWMSQGIFQTEGIRKGVSGGWIMAGGVICYVVLLVISNLVFHRMVTTELFLIVGWAVLNLVTVNTLYASGLFSSGISVVFCVLTLAVVVGSLYCYMIYYNLEKWKGYIDGFLPLVMVGIAMLVMAGVMFYKK